MNIYEFEIPMKNSIRILGLKQNTNFKFWKDIKMGDVLDLTYYMRYRLNHKSPKVKVVINDNIQFETTSTIASKVISQHFDIEIIH